jgi:hypothetical protein
MLGVAAFSLAVLVAINMVDLAPGSRDRVLKRRANGLAGALTP